MAIKLYFFLLLFSATLEAAAPLTHVHFANKWCEKHPFQQKEDYEAFICGTLFPDIRYLGTVSRDKTHKRKVTAREICQAPTPFTGGMWLHAFVDQQRELFIEKNSILFYLIAIPKKNRVLFLKLLEDEILWNSVSPQELQSSLKEVLVEELDFVTLKTAKRWHATLRDYFTIRPSMLLIKLAEEKSGFLQADEKCVRRWVTLLPKYASNTLITHYVEQLVQEVANAF